MTTKKESDLIIEDLKRAKEFLDKGTNPNREYMLQGYALLRLNPELAKPPMSIDPISWYIMDKDGIRRLDTGDLE